MGLYVEPQGISKLEFADFNGEIVGTVLTGVEIGFYDVEEDKIIVCLAKNSEFNVLAVIYNQKEYDRFSRPDKRMKVWYLMPKELVKANTPMWDSMMEEE